MKRSDYIVTCRNVEHRDIPEFLRNIRTGEEGKVVQCLLGDNPAAFLVEVGAEVITWEPEEVEVLSTTH